MADKDFHQATDFVFRAHLIQRNPDGVVLMPAKIDAGFVGPDQDRLGLHLRQTNSNRIEERVRCDIESELPQSCCQHHSQAVDTLGNPPQALRPMVDRIHACHDGQEDLRRTNVARRLLTPDVLFAGLQGESVGKLPRNILGHANDASRHLPFKCFSGRKKRSMGATKSKRDTKSLAGTHGDIGPEFSRCAQEGQGQQIGGDHHKNPGRVGLRHECTVIPDIAVSGRILEQNAGQLRIGKVDGLRPSNAQCHPERFSPRLHHRNGLGMTVLRGEELCPFEARRTGNGETHGHRLRCRRGFIQERGIG